MFFHTLTFFNIFKRSPSKTYLACVISNLCFIIQSSCTHFPIKMQDMNSLPVLHSFSHLLLSPYMWLYPHFTTLPLFMFLFALCCAFWLYFVKYEIQLPVSAFCSPVFSFASLCSPLQANASGFLLISAFIVPLCVHPKLTSQLYIYW